MNVGHAFITIITLLFLFGVFSIVMSMLTEKDQHYYFPIDDDLSRRTKTNEDDEDIFIDEDLFDDD